ncbi:hypothetical protein [Thiorhodococcus minor]|uniref:hypothetical protein n=1 Tax=Thiorhodococcus minor TaxID=57489 RepID=UPI001FD83676|nr:hypothetical protein [Thiorhodococcus minor]
MTALSRKRVDLDLGRRDRDEAKNLVFGDRNLGHSEVMTKLILIRKPLKEPIEIRMSAAESAAIIARLQPPDLKTHECSLGGASMGSSNSACMA